MNLHSCKEQGQSLSMASGGRSAGRKIAPRHYWPWICGALPKKTAETQENYVPFVVTTANELFVTDDRYYYYPSSHSPCSVWLGPRLINLTRLNVVPEWWCLSVLFVLPFCFPHSAFGGLSYWHNVARLHASKSRKLDVHYSPIEI